METLPYGISNVEFVEKVEFVLLFPPFPASPMLKVFLETIETLRLEDSNGNGDVELENALTAHARLMKLTLESLGTRWELTTAMLVTE